METLQGQLDIFNMLEQKNRYIQEFIREDKKELTEEEENKLRILKEYATKDQVKSIEENINLSEVKEVYRRKYKEEYSKRHHLFFKFKDGRLAFMTVFGGMHWGKFWDIYKEERVNIIRDMEEISNEE